MLSLPPSTYRDADGVAGLPSAELASTQNTVQERGAKGADDIYDGLLQQGSCGRRRGLWWASVFGVANQAKACVVWFRVIGYTADFDVLVNGTLTTRYTVTADGWHSIDAANAASFDPGANDALIKAVCFLAKSADQGALSKRALIDFKSKRLGVTTKCSRPHSVSLMRSVDEIQSFALNSYPQTFGSHCALSGVGDDKTLAGSTYWLRYKHRTGPWAHTTGIGGATLWVLITSSDGGGHLDYEVSVGDLSGTDGGTGTLDLGTLSGGSGIGVDNPTWVSHSIARTKLSANDCHELMVKFGSTGVGQTVEVLQVMLVENASPSSTTNPKSALASGALVNDGTFSDEQPERAMHRGSALNSQSPVVGSFLQASRARQARWNDVRSPLNDALFCVMWRPQILVWDQPKIDGGDNLYVTPSVDDPVAIAASKMYPSRGAAGVRFLVDLMMPPVELLPDGSRATLVLTPWVNGSQLGTIIRVAPFESTAPQGVELYVPYETDALKEIEIQAHFEDASHTILTTGLATAQFMGFGIQEVAEAPETSNQYLYDGTANSGSAIPTASGTGVTKTLAVTADLKVRRLRVWVAITHAATSELALTLTGPTGSPHTFVTGSTIDGSGALVGYSDDTLGDIDASGLVASFAGINSVGNWVLKAVNAAGHTAGTLDQFALEIF